MKIDGEVEMNGIGMKRGEMSREIFARRGEEMKNFVPECGILSF